MAIQETRTLTVSIDADFHKVAADLADPMTHPDWAHQFFAGPATPTDAKSEVLAQVPMMGGTVRYKIEADVANGLFDLYLAPLNAPFGAPIPVRLIRNGDGVDVLWTLSRMPGTPDVGWQAGIVAMTKELQALKARHEAGQVPGQGARA
jgi:hypothetical protein